MKNKKQQKIFKLKKYKTDLFPFKEKENLTDNINLSGPPNNVSKYTKNHVFNLHDPLDNIPLSKLEIENIFLPNTEKLTLELLKKHTYKTKPIKADITILGNKTLLRYFRKFNNLSINENTNILEYQTSELKAPCLPLSMILLVFHILHNLNTKGHAGSEKQTRISSKTFTFQMHQFELKY